MNEQTIKQSNKSLLRPVQGEFYNIGQHKEPPFSPPVFGLPPQINSMLYIGVSAFTANSAAFVYNNAGAFNIFITDDMVSAEDLYLHAVASVE